MKHLQLVVLFTMLFIGGCKKDSSNPATVTPTAQIVMDSVSGISATAVNLGRVQIGKTGDVAVTFRNSQSSTANLTGTIAVSGQYYSLLSSSTSFNLVPGYADSYIVSFSPLTAGTFTGTITLTHNATNVTSPMVGNFTGSGF